MSFRTEKKFRLTNSDYLEFRQLCVSLGAKTVFGKRLVNSIYFDDVTLRMFRDSEEGLLPRKKIRVRWYGANTNSFNLEIKISSIEGRYKVSETLAQETSLNSVLNKKIYDPLYGNLTSSLQVSYAREYMLYEGLRITFDEHIRYKNIRKNSAFCSYDPEKVIEIKAPIDYPWDSVECIFPVPTSRFSKYSRGLLLTQGKVV